MKGLFTTAVAALGLTMGASALPSTCNRVCMTRIVNVILKSMVAELAPASISMMTLWRTVTKAGTPSLLAIDTITGSAYFSLAITEGNENAQSVLNARVKVVNNQITELDLFVNRSRGDYGFSLSPEELADNYEQWMEPPSTRSKASCATLEALGAAAFDTTTGLNVTVADDCHPDEDGSYEPLTDSWPDSRPTDANARANLVVDDELGIVVVGALVPGNVYPYGELSAFIPDQMVEAQAAQDEWLDGKLANGTIPLVAPLGAMGEVLEVLQYYDAKLQGEQVNVYLRGPDMSSVWLQ
ncbi:hypothetical protein BJY01DRAFT_236270 [Aspergillus pseudoustus]|uniref:Pyridoxamine 5'-phosphate oxidase-domain-containing protein n=1 Tax=Aspergillus pseudoustus TaxID=1810923 RepID=A0ABR4JNY5_9EURO